MDSSYKSITMFDLPKILVPAWDAMKSEWGQISFERVKLWPLANVPGYLAMKDKVNRGVVKCRLRCVL